MTQHEYQEMLRAALEAIDGNLMGARRYVDLEQPRAAHEHLDEASATIKAALATPPPSNKLRDMREVPRDGSQILALRDGELRWYCLRWVDTHWVWMCNGVPMTVSDFKGWTELPEVSE